MEDAIVAQVEWYMGHVNLQNDDYLKRKMDDDLWVSLDIILAFPKMIRLGVTDKQRVATLLRTRSNVVQVDDKTCRIRPAWAHRSTLVIHDLPIQTRPDEIVALFNPPDRTPATGLLSVHPVEDVFFAVFDTPTGASTALPYLTDKTLHNVKLRVELHVDHSLRSDFRPHLFPSPRPTTEQYPMSPVMPMGMPVPVLHPPPEMGQYAYAPPAYVPAYGQLPRQFIPPRAMPPAPSGYMMAYPQAPSFDQVPVPPQDPTNEDDDSDNLVSNPPHMIPSIRDDPSRTKADFARDHADMPAYRNRPHQPTRPDRARDGTRAPRTPTTVVDGTGRAQNGSRKGKKGSRANNGRHAHDRHFDSRDGKGDPTADNAQRDDRKSHRDDKKKPEPNLNSMHFPPLPLSSDTSSGRPPQPVMSKIPPKEGKNSPTVAPSASSLSSFAPDVSISEENPVITDGKKIDVADSASLDTDSSAVTDTKESSSELQRADTSGDTAAALDAVPDPVSGIEVAQVEKKVAEAPAPVNGGTMSYAAILRSKKPSPRVFSSPRISPEVSSKSPDPSSEPEGPATSSGAPNKERNGRRKKGNHPKNIPNGDTQKDEVQSSSVAVQDKPQAVSPSTAIPEAKSDTNRDSESAKSKASATTNRAHPVWVNKPKSLFLAASSVPSNRAAGSTAAPDGRKSAPAVAQEDEAGKERSFDGEDQGKTYGTGNFETSSSVAGNVANGGDPGDVKEIALEMAAISVADGVAESSKNGKSEQSTANGNSGAAKGAWASGGPKAWPKNNDAMLLERSSGISES